MKAHKLALVFAPVFFVAVVGAGQTLLELKPTGTVTVPGRTANAFIEPIKCDPSSNVYVQVAQESDPPGQTPVTRLSPDGKATVFPVPTNPEAEKLGIIDFAPMPDGGIMLLTTDYKGKNYLETYDDHAQFQSRSPLPAEIDPRQIAVSSKGKVLVGGLYSTPVPGGPGTSRPFAGIFEARGRLEREVVLTEGTQVGEAESPRDSESRTAQGIGENQQAMTFSSAQGSANGNFILARLGSRGPIYIISPAAVELNRVSPPIPDGILLSSVKVDGNMIAAMYIKKKAGSTQNEISDVFISLLDSQTGDEQARFHHSSWQLGAAFACYKAGVFTFLSSGPNDELQIVRAGAQ